MLWVPYPSLLPKMLHLSEPSPPAPGRPHTELVSAGVTSHPAPPHSLGPPGSPGMGVFSAMAMPRLPQILPLPPTPGTAHTALGPACPWGISPQAGGLCPNKASCLC